MTKKQKKSLAYICIAAALFFAGLFFEGRLRFDLMLLAWVLTGWRVAWQAVRTVLRGGVFDEHFLMTVATVGAFVLGDAPEGAAVMIFFRIGELFESLAVERSRKSIAGLMALRADTAFVLRGDAVEEAEPEEIVPGDILLVRPGERIPVDGLIVEGSASLDTAQITGESVPVAAQAGDRVLSGCSVLSGVLKIRAESAYEHSTVAKILELVENAAETKAPTERMIGKFARVYTPIVVLSAVALANVPPRFWGNWGQWVYRALSFLVNTCPCALVISVPLSFFGGMGAAAGQGIIIKGGAVMEQLARARIAAFDKTGTLTKGSFRISGVEATAMPEEALLYYAAAAESMSAHPLGKALAEAAPEAEVQVQWEEPGFGVCALVDGRRVLAGSARLMEREGISLPRGDESACIHVAVDGDYGGAIHLTDAPKDNAGAAISALKALGIRKTVLLTGDHSSAARKLGELLGLDAVYARLLPQDKAEKMKALLREGVVLYTGDGVNDAPVLTLADVGIAMGGVGADAAVEAADVVILHDDLEKLPAAVRISRKTRQIAIENIIFALSVKAAILLLAAFGKASMWLAVFADVGVSVLAICNAIRVMRHK